MAKYIDQPKKTRNAEIYCGGNYVNPKVILLKPTVIVNDRPNILHGNEVFSRVVTIFIYEDKDGLKTLKWIVAPLNTPLPALVSQVDR